MIKFSYTKEKLVKFMRDWNYSKEVLPILKNKQIFIILEKNTIKKVKYIVSVQVWEEIIWQKIWNYSEEIVTSLHLFLIKKWFLSKEIPVGLWGWICKNFSFFNNR